MGRTAEGRDPSSVDSIIPDLHFQTMHRSITASISLVCLLVGCTSASHRAKNHSSEDLSIQTPDPALTSQVPPEWGEYGDYFEAMLGRIRKQWYEILAESRVAPPRGSHVVASFTINSKGDVEMKKVEDAGSGKQGVFACQNAITYLQPYPKWPESMIAALGQEQQVTVTFYYQ